jgi:ribosomal protein L25 (general stress protein Ctc)
MKERERLITLMGKAGWVIYEARREEGSIALKNAPIIKTIRRATSTTLEID